MAWHFWPTEYQPTPAELAEVALNGPTPTERAKAAVQLADYGDEALEQLRRVLQESAEPDVQSACVEGLGKLWDYDSMDVFLDILEKGPMKVRGRAAVIVSRMTGRNRRYRVGASLMERQRWVRYMHEDWEEIRNSAHFDDLKRRLRESHENP